MLGAKDGKWYFERWKNLTALKKKVLLITYYWPPSGGIGVLRCLKIAKYLRENGWEPVIFTADGADYPTLDHSNDHDVPEGATVLRHPIWEPYQAYRKLTGKPPGANVNNVFYVQEDKGRWAHELAVWVRSNFFIPDARCFWIPSAVRFLCRYLKAHPVDAIFSDGPPHTNTRIATLVSRKTGIPWLADFQDPWTQIDYYQLLKLTRWGDARHRRMEQEAFRQASKITIVSPTWKKDLEALGARNVSVIPWGFDPGDYPPEPRAVGGKFAFTHLGIMGYDRRPDVFFKVLADLCRDTPGFQEDLRLKLVGQVDQSVKAALQGHGLMGAVEMPGNVPRSEALSLTLNSPILLLLLNQQPNAQGRIPGKLFEYLAARRPVFCLQPMESDVAGILARAGAGQALGYEDEAGIRQAVLGLYRQYKTGELLQPLASDISPYSIQSLTREIAGFLDEIAG